jgi:hypothetical protein
MKFKKSILSFRDAFIYLSLLVLTINNMMFPTKELLNFI